MLLNFNLIFAIFYDMIKGELYVLGVCVFVRERDGEMEREREREREKHSET